MIIRLPGDFGRAHGFSYRGDIGLVDHAVRQRNKPAQRPGIPADPVLAVDVETGAADRALGAERRQDAHVPQAFRQPPVFQPAPMPLARNSDRPRDQDGDDDRKLRGHQVDLHIRVVDENPAQGQRHGKRGNKEVEDIGTAIDQGIENAEMIGGAERRQQDRFDRRTLRPVFGQNVKIVFPLRLRIGERRRQPKVAQARPADQEHAQQQWIPQAKIPAALFFGQILRQRRFGFIRHRQNVLDHKRDGGLVGGLKAVPLLGVSVRRRQVAGLRP
jgi:hypothetical protein